MGNNQSAFILFKTEDEKIMYFGFDMQLLATENILKQAKLMAAELTE